MYLFYAVSLCLKMKPLHLFSITTYMRTYAALYSVDKKATIGFYSLSQGYARGYLNFIETKRTSHNPNQATQHSP